MKWKCIYIAFRHLSQTLPFSQFQTQISHIADFSHIVEDDIKFPTYLRLFICGFTYWHIFFSHLTPPFCHKNSENLRHFYEVFASEGGAAVFLQPPHGWGGETRRGWVSAFADSGYLLMSLVPANEAGTLLTIKLIEAVVFFSL